MEGVLKTKYLLKSKTQYTSPVLIILRSHLHVFMSAMHVYERERPTCV
jgi:hypothetical protein